MSKKTFAAAAALGLASAAALADPVAWTLDPVSEAHGYTVSGTFTFDADTDTYSDASFNIQHYTSFGLNSGDAETLNFGVANQGGIITLYFDTPLSDAGGIVSAQMLSYKFGNPVYTSATVQGEPQVSAVPEPQSAAMMLAAIGLVRLVCRRAIQRN